MRQKSRSHSLQRLRLFSNLTIIKKHIFMLAAISLICVLTIFLCNYLLYFYERTE